MIETTESPAWPTTLRSRLRDGRLMGTDGSVWVYRKVPMSPVTDAKSPSDALNAAEPLLAAYEELAAMATVTVKRRAMAKGSYRQTHTLLVNVPQFFAPDRSHPNAEYLRGQFGGVAIDRRLLLFGVRLVDKVGGTGGWRAAVDSVVETIVSGQTPLSDFDADFAAVDAALSRAGLVEPTPEEIRLANGWWNHGDYPDTPMLVHADHLHVFDSAESVRIADRAGVDACHTWPEVGVPGQHAITFASVQDLELDFVDPTSGQAAWVSDLVAAGAMAISIRGNVEPSAVTREELRRQRKRFIDDINERYENGKMQRAEQEEMLAMLSGVENMYAGKNVPPTLAGASVIVGFDGQVGDINQVVHPSSPAKLALMTYRQNGGMDEMMLCSPLRQNPNLHDLPAQTVACSGLPSLNNVGDSEGALLGFTERDRQPVYLSPTAASTADGLPIALVAGATGSGKTMVLLNAADQFTRMGRPAIIIDPKTGSSHDEVVLAAGGQVASLDSLTSADGIFDPLRFSATRDVGVELAASMLMSINPWGNRKDDMEVPLTHALHHGAAQGATCIGEALAIAERDLPTLPPDMIKRIRDLADSSPMFRACVGVTPGTTGLRAAEGITLIKVGNAFLDLPEPGAAPASISQRIALALVRMMVFGSAMALTGRGGAVMLDEAWVFLGAGRAEVERLGRLARSQEVLPMLFTQRVTDAVNAGLSGYISRGLILPIEDADEARAACDLFKLEATPGRMGRITAKATMGASAGSVAPNWHSMRALRDPQTGRVLRGSIAIYADLAGRAIPVEMTLGEEFLRLASTNPEDIRRRQEAQAARAAQLAAAAVQAHTDTRPDAGGAVVDQVF
ncbi:ATP-binding protein [Nocardioides pakistanensis]